MTQQLAAASSTVISDQMYPYVMPVNTTKHK